MGYNMKFLGYFSVLACLTSPFCAYAQSLPALDITSPATRTNVRPGEVMHVIVRGSAQPANAMEGVMGEGPLGASDVQTSAAERTFTLNVPDAITPGSYKVTAVETLADGTLIQSAPILLVVPQAGQSTALIIKNSHIHLAAIGQKATLNVLRTVGSKTLIVGGDDVSFTALNPDIATVDRNGEITAQAIGIAKVIVNSGDVSATATVLVSGTSLRGDFNGDGQVDINDVRILKSAIGTPANGPNDPRDLNHDGKIDTLDAGILSTLCTYPNCATHP